MERTIASSKKPYNTHLIIETSNKYLYFVDSADQSKILKTIDEGVTQTTVYNADNVIVSMSYDRTSELIWFVKWVSATRLTIYTITLSNDTVTSRFNTASVIEDVDGVADAGTYDCATVVEVGATSNIYNFRSIIGVGNSANASGVNLGDSSGRTYEMSMVVEVSGYLWFLFQWSDESVRMCRMQMGGNNANNYGILDAVDTPDLPVQNQQGLTYDGVNTISFVLDYSGTRYYCTYEIDTGTYTKVAEYDIALMVNRHTNTTNPDPFTREKGFDIAADKVYVQSREHANLWLISVQDFADTIIAITDTYLICNGAELYKLQDFMSKVIDIEFKHKKYDYAKCNDFTVDGNYILIVEDMFIQFTGNYTNVTNTYNDVIIFEGYVENYSDKVFKEVKLVSPAESDLAQEPEGEYSGRTDEIIVDLIGDYCNYITAGTLSAGQAMGTIKFSGDKTLKTILMDFSSTDFFVWKLRPTGVLDYDDGTNDTGVDYSESSTPKAYDVDGWHPNRNVNYVEVWGGIPNGEVFFGLWQDLASQQTYGYIIFIYRNSFLNTNALCATTATQLGSRDGAQIRQAELSVQDITAGMCQVGEEITFAYSTNDITIGSDQFVIDEVYYNGKREIAEYKATNGVIFTKKQKEGDMPQQNSQMIQQNRETINSVAGGLAIYLHQDASADIATYLKMCTDAPDDAKTQVLGTTITADAQLLKNWATPVDCPGTDILLEGIYSLHCHSYKFSGTKDIRIYFEVYKRILAGTETLLGTSEESGILADSEETFEIHASIAEVALLTTDRLVLKVYGNIEGVGSNPVIYFYVEGDTLVRLQVPVSGIQAADLAAKQDKTINAWKVLYSDTNGLLTELALGAASTYLMSNGAAAAPTFETAGGKPPYRMWPIASNGATLSTGYITQNAVGERVYGFGRIGDDVDDTQDISIRFTFERGDANNDTVAYSLSLRVTTADNSGDTTLVENATGISLPATVNGRYNTYTYTLVAANYVAGQHVFILFSMNEAARTIYARSIDMELSF